MRQWMRTLGWVGAAAALASGAIAAAQTVPTPGGQPAAPLCIVRTLDPAQQGLTGEAPDLSAWVTVKQPTYAYVSASGLASGRDLGHVGLRLLRDGTLLAGSGDVSGTGLLEVKVRGGTYLVPGRQYRFVVTPALRDVKLTALKLRIGSLDCR